MNMSIFNKLSEERKSKITNFCLKTITSSGFGGVPPEVAQYIIKKYKPKFTDEKTVFFDWNGISVKMYEEGDTWWIRRIK